MMAPRHFFSRNVLPLAVFAGTVILHFVWLGLFPEQDPAQNRWVTVSPPASGPWLPRYVETQGYWLGFSYALSLSFAVTALRRYREEHLCTHRNLAAGGATLSGIWAVAGCYLIGCYGSPMLAVYLSLFGATFVPLAKPMIAVLTVLFIGTAWLWMNRSFRPSKTYPHLGSGSK